jgi:hypothetical protein
MANKKSNKISIRPIGNAQAIASTLGISAALPKQVAPAAKRTVERSESDSSKSVAVKENKAKNTQQTESNKENDSPAVSRAESNPAPKVLAEAASLPLIIEIKRRLPGKELFILSLLYKQKNSRGLVQMTVNGLMNLYYSVFDDTIKDDTVRRSLKRLADAALVQTKSIPGHNAGYVYEIDDLLETDAFTLEEKEEFSALMSFVESKLNAPPR